MSIFVLVVLCFGIFCWVSALVTAKSTGTFVFELICLAAFILAVVFQSMVL